ncbi:MAG: asparaginase [Candidatus Eisenbacteria bacterium]
MTQQSFSPAVQVTRGIHPESSHRGAIAVVDSGGRLVASLGNPSEPAYIRSCAKPFQALALVCSGAADALGVTPEELATACGSHSGEPEHVQHVLSLLRRAGLDESALRCGVHVPFDRPARDALDAQGMRPSPLHNNCSGKHAAMLATAHYLDLPLEGYTDPEHGVQVAIRGILGFLCGLEPDEIQVATDGCNAPTFRLPLRSFSLALARLAAEGESVQDLHTRPGRTLARRHRGQTDAEEIPYEDEAQDEDELDEVYDPPEEDRGGEPTDAFPVPIAQGLRRIWAAMRAHPRLVAGSRGRLCTDLMLTAESLGVPLVAKSGAEGAYAIAAVQDGLVWASRSRSKTARSGARLGSDRDPVPALAPPGEGPGPLAGYHRQTILNLVQEPVGEIRPIFKLSLGLPA